MTWEGNILFSDTLSTFSIRLYGVGYMVQDNRQQTCATAFNLQLGQLLLRLARTTKTTGAGSAHKRALRWTHPDIAASTTSNSVGSNASSIDTTDERPLMMR